MGVVELVAGSADAQVHLQVLYKGVHLYHRHHSLLLRRHNVLENAADAAKAVG